MLAPAFLRFFPPSELVCAEMRKIPRSKHAAQAGRMTMRPLKKRVYAAAQTYHSRYFESQIVTIPIVACRFDSSFVFCVFVSWSNGLIIG